MREIGGKWGRLDDVNEFGDYGDTGGGSTRGEALRRRRLALGIKSVRELQHRSGISREAITSAEAGTASAATYERLDAWFTRLEAQGAADPRTAQVEFEVQSDEGVRVVVRGPISDAEELERSVERIIRNLRHAG